MTNHTSSRSRTFTEYLYMYTLTFFSRRDAVGDWRLSSFLVLATGLRVGAGEHPVRCVRRGRRAPIGRERVAAALTASEAILSLPTRQVEPEHPRPQPGADRIDSDREREYHETPPILSKTLLLPPLAASPCPPPPLPPSPCPPPLLPDSPLPTTARSKRIVEVPKHEWADEAAEVSERVDDGNTTRA